MSLRILDIIIQLSWYRNVIIVWKILKLLWKIYMTRGKKTIIKPEPNVTFIQADSFNKVISLVENLNESPMTTGEIAELFGFKERTVQIIILMHYLNILD